MSHAIFSRALCYFLVFSFILQSKEYPRNVPGNPTRKCVEKEVCKKKGRENQDGRKEVNPSKAAIITTYQLPNQSANWDERGTHDSDKPWHEC